MAILHTQIQTYGGLVDFATMSAVLGNPVGGIGSGNYDLAIPVPAGTLPLLFGTITTIIPTITGSLSFSFSAINNSVSPATVKANYFMPTTSVAVFATTLGQVIYGVVPTISPSTVNPPVYSNAYSIALSITGTGKWTAGQLQLFMQGVSFNFAPAQAM